MKLININKLKLKSSNNYVIIAQIYEDRLLFKSDVPLKRFNKSTSSTNWAFFNRANVPTFSSFQQIVLRNPLDTAKLAEMEMATILKGSFEKRRYFSLSHSFFIKTCNKSSSRKNL